MMTEADNLRLGQVGRGTPMGEVLRRYWHPIAAEAELVRERVMPVKLLGESLALYRTPSGVIGLVHERCAHRGVSLAYGMVTDAGIRCPNHGWTYDGSGRCVAQPFEETVNPQSGFKDKVRIAAYPTEVMGGLVWAYLGPPERRPLLPRWEAFAREDVRRSIGVTVLPCNWFQCMEGSVDPVHFEWLHAHYLNYLAEEAGEPPVMRPARHLAIAFERFTHGIYKRRLCEGDDPETSPDWRIGHPILFPNLLSFRSKRGGSMQIRVPIDDVTTWHLWFNYHDLGEGEAPSTKTYEVPFKKPDGRFDRDRIAGTDMLAWITQGPLVPRHLEHLGASDTGVILLRKVMLEAMDAVARGEDPPGLVRDAALNEPFLAVHHEEEVRSARAAFHLPDGKIRRLTELAG